MFAFDKPSRSVYVTLPGRPGVTACTTRATFKITRATFKITQDAQLSRSERTGRTASCAPAPPTTALSASLPSRAAGVRASRMPHTFHCARSCSSTPNSPRTRRWTPAVHLWRRTARSVLGSWVGVRRLLHHSLFLTASRMVLPNILVPRYFPRAAPQSKEKHTIHRVVRSAHVVKKKAHSDHTGEMGSDMALTSFRQAYLLRRWSPRRQGFCGGAPVPAC